MIEWTSGAHIWADLVRESTFTKSHVDFRTLLVVADPILEPCVAWIMFEFAALSHFAFKAKRASGCFEQVTGEEG